MPPRRSRAGRRRRRPPRACPRARRLRGRSTSRPAPGSRRPQEAGSAEGCDHLVRGRARVGGAGSRVLAGEVADPSGVATLDGDDLGCGRKRLLRQIGGLAVVRGNASVLEQDGGVEKLLLVPRRIAEVEPRTRPRRGAQRLLEVLHVVALVLRDDLREVAHLPLEAVLVDALAVERRLKVFEEEGVVEDLLVLSSR